MLGYVAYGAYVEPNSRFFAIERVGERIVNVHVFEPDDVNMRKMLTTRDYLRAHPNESLAYEALKSQLNAQHPDDYFVYRDGKRQFLAGLCVRAEEWRLQKLG